MKDNFENPETPPLASDDVSEEYIYQSAGIGERKGFVPVWLIWVALGLMIWAVYYLFSYWSPIT